MNKRNLILIALAITTVLVFTQIVSMAAPAQCIITPGTGCPACPPENEYGSVCHAGGVDCNAEHYWDCCIWAQGTCGLNVYDKTKCGLCCA